MDNNVQLQLETVEQALLVANDDSERASLLSLRNDLLELMELTRQTEGLVADTAVKNETKHLDNEMQQFMQEIQELDSEAKPANESKNAANVEAELLELRQQLESMVGEKCSAPHHHSWGATTYHNAIICGIGQTVDADSDGTLGEICLQVLFTNPTHREMLPCTYFLEGECKFDAAKCHYSHGELVPFGDLREYTEPDFEKLARNCVVLAKMEDRLWHRGRVLCSNFMEKQCRVRLDGNQHKVKELDFSFENLFPIYHDEDLSSGSSSNEDTDSESSEELDELEAARRARLIEQSLFTFPANQPLGEWEKHTRGIGSKLMAKMGYIHGTGLGDNGRGIITPISAQILPQGCSLDHCMQLREAANGDKDLFSVEKQLKRKQKKQEAINVKAYERETQRVDVFSFLNDTIFTKAQKSDNIAGNSSVAAKPTSKASIQNQTTKSLNVESVRIADDIRKKEREISKVKESLHRNSTSTSDVHKRLQAQLSNMTDELNTLKRAEHSLTKEQAKRKTKDKLCVF